MHYAPDRHLYEMRERWDKWMLEFEGHVERLAGFLICGEDPC